ncbi:septum formation family protein [Nocardiopsis sp. RSe5-2]|uniref:Septum formation family protein n=1 Tax=Nocardiopsis endophytica TaxID=3018445 RepID=A0ABT4TY85_9ACTN|nr:septum formation family protein [Nocardiopsis endophytica]MDA2809654.1 septum formation family protein [Nocardiopsis endophytica]
MSLIRPLKNVRTAAAAGAVGAVLALSACGGVAEDLQETADEMEEQASAAEESGEVDADVFEVAVGDCLNDESVAEDQEVAEVPKVSCDEPHDSEVYAETEMEASEWPGDAGVDEEASAFCEQEFASFVGLEYAMSELQLSYYVPTEDSFASGDRAISCLIYDEAGQTTGSLAGAAR